MTADRSYEGDDLRNDAPKFQPGRLPQYLAAVEELKALARERFGKSVLALAVRWVLDQGPTIALWGARDPGQLAPLDEIDGWRIDDDARAEIDAILVRCIRVVAVAESEPGTVGAPDRRRLTNCPLVCPAPLVYPHARHPSPIPSQPSRAPLPSSAT